MLLIDVVHTSACTSATCINGQCGDDGTCHCKPGYTGYKCDTGKLLFHKITIFPSVGTK